MAEYKTLVKKIPVSPDKKTKQKDYLKKGRLPIVDQGQSLVGGYTDDADMAVKCELPVIVFGDHTRAVKYITFPFGAGADGIKVLQPKENILPLFLYYATQYIVAKMPNRGYARHYQYVEKEDLPVPPLPEQERIVARIEELFSQLDAGVETLKKAKAQLAVYRQAVLKEAFEGRLTIHVPVNLPLSWASSDETNTLPAIPEEWHYIALKYLGDLGRGKSKHRPRNDPKLFVDGKYPFIQTGDVKAATNCITTFTKQYGEFGLSQSKLWPKGTLCITIAANIAETAFLGIDACFPDSVVGFTPNESILAEYVRYFVESQKIRLWAFAPATAQKNINLDTLENLIVPYCSIDEQRVVISEIESRLSVCDSIEQTVDAALQQAEAMRQSILKDAFEGKLT